MPVPSKINSKENIQKLIKYYAEEKLSTTQISSKSEEIFGFKISPSSIYNTLIKNKIDVRSKSESVGAGKSFLNYSCSYETEEIIEWVDGFNLGDGYMSVNKKKKDMWTGSRYMMGSVEKEWCEYAMSGLSVYLPSEPKQYGKIREKAPRLTWTSRTSTHPEIFKQAKRWYPEGTKKVPEDVRITPTSILLWYLGDGCNVRLGISNRIRFATCSFDPDDIDNILVPKLMKYGLEVWRDKSKKNDIVMSSRSVNRFFEIIGKKSPISCYNYKFEFHQWLVLKRLSDVVPDRKTRWRVQYMFKRGKLDCTLSPGGKMILFTPDQERKLLEVLNGHSFHDDYEDGVITPYKREESLVDEDIVKLSYIVKTSQERWNARYFIVKDMVESLKGSKFTKEQAKILREKLDFYGEKSAIPEKDIHRNFLEARSWGFPYYEIDNDEFIRGIESLRGFKVEKKDNLYNWNGGGSKLASYFHPHMFECKKAYKMSALEFYNSNDDFRRGIWKVLALYGKITKSNIREICRNEKESSRINQFPPRVAISVLKDLFPNGGIKMLDPTHGFGGRLLGSCCSGLVRNYTGIDLSEETHKGCKEMVKWLEGHINTEVELIFGDCLDKMGFLEDDFDLVFTSPPFLDTERYKGVVYETDYGKWKEMFLYPFCECCYSRLRRGGKFAVYLGNIGRFDFIGDFKRICLDVGFSELSPVSFKMAYGENNRARKTVRPVDVLVFRKD